jgi:hypothetical protein
MVGKSEENRISHGPMERLHKKLHPPRHVFDKLLTMLVPLATNLVVLLIEVEGR